MKNMITSNKSPKRMIPMLVTLVVFGVIGVVLLRQSNAEISSASVEVEAGTVSGPATKLTDTTASGGSAIKFGSAAATSTNTLLVNSNFESATVANPMLLNDFRVAMNDSAVAYTGSLTKTSVLSESGHGKFMRQGLDANTVGGGNGIVAIPKLKQVVTEASMQYDVRFVGDFDWRRGGKLPGLGGATDGKPGVAAGCADGVSTAWSGRGMWGGPPGTNATITKYGSEWIGYMYNKYKTSDCGDNVQTYRGFKANTWHTIKQYYKMNTPGVSDGVHKMWLDGELVVNNSTYQYRDNTALGINYIFWSIFRGGSDPTIWASPTMGYIDFDNIVVSSPGL